MSQPSLRGRVVLKFPANVVAGPGITIDKTNSTYTISATGGGGGGGGGIEEAPIDGQQYGRQSGAWTVVTGGGTGTTAGNPLLIEKGTAPQIGIIGTVGGLNRWRVNLGDSVAESGIATGSNFHIESYNNDGSYRNLVLHANRETSEVTITAGPAPHDAILGLNKLLDGQACTFQGLRSGSLRWGMALGDSVLESGGNAGSNFRINTYTDAGAFLSAPFFIERSTGRVMLTGGAFTSGNVPILAINKLDGSGGQASAIQGYTAGVTRWGLSLGDSVAETGGAAGSNFRVNAYDDAGNFINAPLFIERSTSKTMLTGGSFTGTGVPILAINKLVSGQAAAIQGQTAGVARWGLTLGDVLGESGTSAGSDLRINRYNNAGTLVDVPFWIKRDTGTVVMTGTHPPQEAMLAINKTAGGLAATIQGQTATVKRWDLVLGDGAVEHSTASGSDFRIHRYNNAGALIDVPMWIRRDNGVTTFTGSPPDQAPILVINKTSGTGGQSSSIQGQTLTSTRWHLALGDGQPEIGGLAGSNFRIHRHADDGTFLDAAMYIERSSLLFAVYGDPFCPGGGSWNAISDARIKTVTGDYTKGLTEVLALHPVKYTYKGNDSQGPGFPSNHAAVAARGQEFIGLVAQEAETVMPEMVKQATAYIDGVQVADMRQMDTSALIYALINAVKELSARVEALEGAP